MRNRNRFKDEYCWALHSSAKLSLLPDDDDECIGFVALRYSW